MEGLRDWYVQERWSPYWQTGKMVMYCCLRRYPHVDSIRRYQVIKGLIGGGTCTEIAECLEDFAVVISI